MSKISSSNAMPAEAIRLDVGTKMEKNIKTGGRRAHRTTFQFPRAGLVRRWSKSRWAHAAINENVTPK